MVSAWHLWMIAAMLLFVAEIFIPTFVPASFGIGCLISSFAAFLDAGLNMQIAAFIAGTLGAFFGVRPFFTKYCYKASAGVKTNVDALLGKTGRVTETIDDDLGSGRVAVGGDDWKAVAADGGVIARDSKVEVVGVEGVKVFVKPLESTKRSL